jgi:hypothetical protein
MNSLAVPTEMSSTSTFRQVQANRRSRHPIDKNRKLHLFIALKYTTPTAKNDFAGQLDHQQGRFSFSLVAAHQKLSTPQLKPVNAPALGRGAWPPASALLPTCSSATLFLVLRKRPPLPRARHRAWRWRDSWRYGCHTCMPVQRRL